MTRRAASCTAELPTGTVYGFGIDQVSGALTALSGSPFPSGGEHVRGGGGRLGRFVYVGSQANGGGMVALAINPTTGALTTVTGSPFAAPGGILAITTTAAGTGSTATLVSLDAAPESADHHDVAARIECAVGAGGHLQ